MTTLISPHRFTTDDYHRLVGAGALHEDDRVELIDGQIHDMMPIGPFHGGCVKWLSKRFQSLSGDRWITSTQDPVVLSEHDEPQPDLTLLRPTDDFYANAHPRAEDVFLLIEVSDSTLQLDREKKLPLYARYGIHEVWIVNLQDEAVEVYRKPTGGSYTVNRTAHSGEQLSPAAFEDASIDLDAMFRLAR